MSQGQRDAFKNEKERSGQVNSRRAGANPSFSDSRSTGDDYLDSELDHTATSGGIYERMHIQRIFFPNESRIADFLVIGSSTSLIRQLSVAS